MKKTVGILLGLVLMMIFAFALADVEINETNFPDENFRVFVKQYDTDVDNVLSEDEITPISGTYSTFLFLSRYFDTHLKDSFVLCTFFVSL